MDEMTVEPVKGRRVLIVTTTAPVEGVEINGVAYVTEARLEAALQEVGDDKDLKDQILELERERDLSRAAEQQSLERIRELEKEIDDWKRATCRQTPRAAYQDLAEAAEAVQRERMQGIERIKELEHDKANLEAKVAELQRHLQYDLREMDRQRTALQNECRDCEMDAWAKAAEPANSPAALGRYIRMLSDRAPMEETNANQATVGDAMRTIDTLRNDLAAERVASESLKVEIAALERRLEEREKEGDAHFSAWQSATGAQDAGDAGRKMARLARDNADLRKSNANLRAENAEYARRAIGRHREGQAELAKALEELRDLRDQRQRVRDFLLG